MIQIKKLFRITNKLGTFYVVATSFNAAAKVLMKRLDAANYGTFTHREIQSIDQLAIEHFFPEDT